MTTHEMETAIAESNGQHQVTTLEQVLVGGDLNDLSSEQRIQYYNATCQSLELNPLTRPFEYIKLNGKLVLYARKDCTDQLRSNRNVSIQIVSREQVGDVYAVTARATLPGGRTDEAIGAVAVTNLKGDALANALMKAETKAKRRVTLSIAGLGLTDETELETIPSVKEQRRKLEASSEPIEEMSAEEQVKYWSERFGETKSAKEMAGVYEAIQAAGVSDEIKLQLSEAYEIAKARIKAAKK